MKGKRNKVMRIAIVDDERPAREGLRYEIEDLRSDVDIIFADSGMAAVQLLSDKTVDLLFLDVNLGDANGTALVPTLHKLQHDMMICFVTAYSDYAIKAFELGVDDYIMKPFDNKRIEKVIQKAEEKSAINRIIKKVDEGKAKIENEDEYIVKKLPIHGKDRTIYVDIDEIIYIETYERGCNIYTATNMYFDMDNIGMMEKKLPELFRVHKSYMVNPSKVKEIFPWSKNSYCIKVDGYPNENLPIGRDKIKALRDILDR